MHIRRCTRSWGLVLGTAAQPPWCRTYRTLQSVRKNPVCLALASVCPTHAMVCPIRHPPGCVHHPLVCPTHGRVCPTSDPSDRKIVWVGEGCLKSEEREPFGTGSSDGKRSRPWNLDPNPKLQTPNSNPEPQTPNSKPQSSTTNPQISTPEQIYRNFPAVARWRSCKALVVDEISMVDQELFTKVLLFLYYSQA